MKVLVAIILFVSLCGLISCSGHFTVIGAKSVNQNGTYSVAITSRHFNDSDPPILEVAIHSKAKRIAQNITLTNGKSQSLEFDINGSVADDYVNLTINCVRGLNFNATVKLNLNTKNESIFVQTDKAIYKPSDVVRFRLLVLDENLQLLNASNVRIYVIDGAQNRVQQFMNPVFRKGVFEEKFSLSDSAILGNWHIETLLSNNVVKRQMFEVVEYTLPSFEIILDVKPHVSFAEKQITAFLVAKHTFTEAAKGNATITAEVENNKKVKSMNISGKTTVVFHIEDDLGLNVENPDQTVKLFVTFTEEVTGKSQNKTAIVQLHAVPYRLLIKTKSDDFKPGLPFTIEATVQYHDNNVLLTDNENPVTVNVTLVEETICNYTQTFIKGKRKRPRVVFKETCFGGLSALREFKAYLTNGTSKIQFRVPENVVSLSVSASYLQTKISKNQILSAPSEQNHFIVIKSKTQTPTLNENVTINIQSVKHFTEFSYHVFTTQGRLITSDTIQVVPTKDHDFEFTPTDDIKSKIKIIVFYITDYGEIVFDWLHLEFNELKNFVDVQISEESVEPNDEIRIDITSSPNSYVGLLATDRSLSVLNKRVNDISAKIIDENKSDVFFIIHPGSESYIQFSASNDSSRSYYDDQDEEEEPQEDEFRKSFPETWLFDMVDFDVNQTNGSISWRAPDTITNWTIIAFSINPTTGLAETSRPSTLKVFKPFFISMDLPYSIIQNEIVSIPISVFNYMEDDQDAHITLYNENSEFTFIEDWQHSSDKQMTKTLFVNNNNGASTSFKIRANRIGSIKMKAYVKSLSSPGDGTERYLLVKPEGITQYMNKAVLIDLRNHSQYTTNLNIFIPQDAVIGSIRIEASIIIGDILGLTGNLKNLVKLPVGCSEQNMVHFVPNIVILDYLSSINKLTEEVKTVAIENLEVAYQKQLNYKNDDGSFNVWGKSNEPGGTWLTAFIVKSFHQAKTYIFVEADIIVKGLLFLSQKQSADGSFEEFEHVFQKGIQSASSNRIALTAYVLITFLENSDCMERHNSTIIKAISFISQNFDSITDNYSLAIATYALLRAHLDYESLKNTFLTKLEETAVRDGETMRWKLSRSEFPGHNNPFERASSLDIETTAYALHAFVAAGRLQDSERIAKWLVTQRNENGGFISTQDTVVALEALSKVAVNIYSFNTDMDVKINSVLEFSVSESKALLLQKKNLPTSARHFEITATGRGFGILQISYLYNMDQFVDNYKLNISPPNIRNTVDEKRFYLEFCVNYNQDETSLTSKMAVLEVKFPTGCTLMKNFKKELESTESIKRVDYADTSVTVFIDPLSADDVCPRFHYSKGKYVDNAKEGSISVYDPYNIKHQARRLF